MNVLLIGDESAGIQMLRVFSKSRHRIIGVMASPLKKGIGEATLWDVAEKMGYRTWPAKLVKDQDFAKTVRSEKVDIILNVHSLFIINNEVLSAPRLGSFNMHPGPLPRYAGLNTVSWAIYRGEKTYGVTVHKMVPELDAGTIAYQSFFDIDEQDTALSVYSKCIRGGVKLVSQLVDTASTDPGAIPQIPQNFGQREYFGKDAPEAGRLSWSRPAREIFNFVRACDYFPFPSPWGHPRCRKGEHEIGIAKASLTGRICTAMPGTIDQSVESGIYVGCMDEWLLVHRLMVEGQYKDPAEVLKAGYRLDDGR